VSVAARAIAELRVLRDGQPAGVLRRTRQGASFQYDDAYVARGARGLAVHLPLRAEPYEVRGVNLHPFFANLLPEGARLSALIASAKSARDDLLTLASRVGADTVGDVSLVALDASIDDAAPTLDPARASEVSFRELFERSLAYGGAHHERQTIAGAQEKISAAMISFPVRSRGSRSGAAILKLEPPSLPRLVHNEHFFMRAAADAGLEVAACGIVHDRDGAPGLLVQRFDRVRERDGRVRRVHQEDGCQLLDRYPADKYAVATEDLADALEVCVTPKVEIAKLVRLIAYSYVIANGDLHAKNISVVAAGPSERLTLSPAYDLLSSLPYGDAKMALKLGGRDAKLKRSHFVALAARHGIPAKAVATIVAEVCDGIGPWISRVAEIGLPARKTAHLERTIAARRDDLR
jgi:serine/threonine-protein kinase HipA